MPKQKRNAYLELHFSVILFGFTAILGRLIEMSEYEIVWYRLLITSLSLLLWPGAIKAVINMPKIKLVKLLGVGIIVSMHWLCFYGSIKASNVTVALSTFAVTSLFTSIIEPLYFKEKFSNSNLFLGLFVIPGMYLIYSFGNGYHTGILLGLCAALLAAVFSTLNRKLVRDTNPIHLTLMELGSGWIFISLLFPFVSSYFPNATFVPSAMDFAYLLILALLCTSVAYVVSNHSLRQLSAFTATLTVNLEPVYGIILAWLIFSENKEVGYEFYLGTFIILLSVFLHPFLERRFHKQTN